MNNISICCIVSHHGVIFPMDCWGHRRMTPRIQRRLPPGCCCRGWRCHGDWSPECRRCRLVPFHRLWSAGCSSWEERRGRTTKHGERYKKLFYRKAQIYLVNLHWIIILHSNPPPPDLEIRTKADGLNCYDDGDGGGKQPHPLRQFSDEDATRGEAERYVDVE